jgi:hypothetical protein
MDLTTSSAVNLPIISASLRFAGCLYRSPINPLHIIRAASADTIRFHNKFDSFHDFTTSILRAVPIHCLVATPAVDL